MREIEKDKLHQITGGSTSISGPILNGVIKIIEMIKDAGYSLGSGIRRIGENDLCPLK